MVSALDSKAKGQQFKAHSQPVTEIVFLLLSVVSIQFARVGTGSKTKGFGSETL